MAPSKRVTIVGSNNHSSRKKSHSATASNPTARRATRSMITDAARKSVLSTNELLEQIILYLPIKNIFGIQRVCQQFRDIIASSTKIQTKMFLRLQNNVSDEAWVLERLNRSRFVLADDLDVRFRKVDHGTRARLYRPVSLNPLLDLKPLVQRPPAA